MDSSLPILYLSVLLILLATAGFTILRQVLKTRQTEMAISRLQSQLSNEKGAPEDYYQLGSIYLDKKLYSQAINQFQKALKAEDPEDEILALTYNGLGFAYFAQEQYDLAIRNYKEALKAQPNYVTGINNLAHAYERKKLTAQALQTYEDALKYDPENDTAKRRAESLRKRFVTSA
ncbi:MAG TPA: tetratricopeptide repeat protein [Oculatellaceae cyanobacterium]|jgi:tetratricopeptide (TPR) repeat protein